MSFKLPELPFAHDALEPHIDARTMEIHHGKHHAGYTNKLNAAIEGTDLEGKSIEDILTSGTLSVGVRNNGGGYFNHCMFWDVMSPNGGGLPEGDLASAIDRDFGSLEAFKEAFSNAAATRFGSGWAWFRLGSSLAPHGHPTQPQAVSSRLRLAQQRSVNRPSPSFET